MKIHPSLKTNLEPIDYKADIELLKEHGHIPIAVSYFMFEKVYAFETEEEAQRAFEQFEKERPAQITGWWYGRDRFMKSLEDIKQRFDTPPEVIWL